MKFIIISILITIVILHGCSNSKENQYFRPTQKQVDEFIIDHGITPLETKQFENYTMVVYETPTVEGYFILWTNENGDLKSTHSEMASRLNNGPISVMFNEKPAYVILIIHEKVLLKKTKKIQLLFTNNEIIESEDINKAMIVLQSNDNISTLEKIVLFDENGQKLLEEQF
ncbi:hypothetical protein T458_18750 [Brevibacillus panacihumi W25]|uniref:DUF4825 domain-containing protein n=1 Tax=Brevibacillus panacihumi W25 TaxID=1408254 RepID=V6M6B8_9BACL|nr:hypothetical protein [Brevibacillus panacihumi]EST53857.1 hypothetical protein T458_18750 [Brevibacillus panacihumi W25]